MAHRKLIGASLFFTLFGAMALLPPLVLLFQLDVRVFGVPIETLYVFALWAVLIVGGRWFSRALPHDETSDPAGDDRNR